MKNLGDFIGKPLVVPFVLHDLHPEHRGNQVSGNVTFYEGKSIGIHIDGYGDHVSEDGSGEPIYIEFYEGHLRVLCWADINEEDPTHKINMEGARESNRAPDEESHKYLWDKSEDDE